MLKMFLIKEIYFHIIKEKFTSCVKGISDD